MPENPVAAPISQHVIPLPSPDQRLSTLSNKSLHLPTTIMHDVQPPQHSLCLLHQIPPPLPSLHLILAQLHGIQFQNDLRQYRLAKLLVLLIPRLGVLRRARDILYALRHQFRMERRRNLIQLLNRRLRRRGRRRPRRARGHGIRRRSQVFGPRTRAPAPVAVAVAAFLALCFLAAVAALLLAGARDRAVDLDRRRVDAVGSALGILVYARVGGDGFADDAEELALLLEAFGFAGLEVVLENAAFVEQFDAARVVGAGLAGGFFAQVADRQIAVADAVGGEVQRVGDASVFQAYDVRT